MSYGYVEQPPSKKRRFFDPEPEPEPVPQPQITRTASDNLPSRKSRSLSRDVTVKNIPSSPEESRDGFDKLLFESIVGEIPKNAMKVLQAIAGSNTEKAINMYLDGSWQNTASTQTIVSRANDPPLPGTGNQLKGPSTPSQTLTIVRTKQMPEYRYVGAFGVAGWTTRSGSGLIKHGETVHIERQKSKQVKLGRGGKPIPLSRQRADVIVRFTNDRGEEVGRLPKEAASWVSSLIDSKVCHFEGTCVFAPERVRINETIYLQLRCYLTKRTFDTGFVKPVDNNRATGVFEEKETTEEQELRLRQVALVKLFEEINLHPSSSNELKEKEKRNSLLQAAETAERDESREKEKKSKPMTSSPSTPPTDEEESEEGKELEQDQLDTLYKKAQSFDFDTPEQDPASSFVLDLRRYQRQALHWMMSKEKDERANGSEASMHPLWEEYKWPVKDVDDKDLPRVEEQDSFYVNPYSGELSLDFPTQEQHCLGGILADGTLYTITQVVSAAAFLLAFILRFLCSCDSISISCLCITAITN